MDIDGILELAGEAPELAAPETEMLIQKDTAFGYRTEEKVRIGVADDEAFCFFYADNFNLLEQMGAELVRFSPIHDRELPEDLDGLLLSGGYPELNGEALERKQEMCTGSGKLSWTECPVWQNVADSCIFIRRWRIWKESSAESAG